MNPVKYIIKSFFICLIIILSSQILTAEDKIRMPAFGTQIINVEETTNAKILIQKILGNIPYKMTPGDTYKIVIQLDETYTLGMILDQNYELEIPFIGTINVKGRDFAEVRHEIIQQIKAERIVDFVEFTLVAPALFEVFIYGGVENPGFVTLTAVNTLWEAIVSAKGFKPGGSYRNIQLTRNNETKQVDLTQFVRYGDLDQNPRLQPGDKIYVPHAEILTEIKGSVFYPDKFELLPGETLYDLIEVAGGFTPDADKSHIAINRLDKDGSIHIEYIDESRIGDYRIQNADIVNITSNLANKEMLLIEGPLYGIPPKGTEPAKIPTKPLVFTFPYIKGLTLLNLLETFGGPTPLADAENSYIIRDKTGEKIPVDVNKLWLNKDSKADILLEPSDHIFIPVKKLKVIVAGEVNIPNAYPYQTNAKVSDYILVAGGIDAEKGDPNRIFFIDESGKKTKVTLDTEVFPGCLIYVDRNGLEKATFAAGKVAVIVGLIAAVISIAVDINDIIHNTPSN